MAIRILSLFWNFNWFFDSFSILNIFNICFPVGINSRFLTLWMNTVRRLNHWEHFLLIEWTWSGSRSVKLRSEDFLSFEKYLKVWRKEITIISAHLGAVHNYHCTVGNSCIVLLRMFCILEDFQYCEGFAVVADFRSNGKLFQSFVLCLFSDSDTLV